ncbi:MAG TPA: hypothetical protein VND96_04485 [Candidatus Micrarchaeaceae archaeon]|nr:hypothetical protein [Candidatus Micrarchaeaceae archaeon]
MAGSPRTILFGLRTNVQFFASHLGYAALDTRLKTFSLLFDQVVLEKGVYEANIGEQGSFETVSPGLDRPEQLRPARTKRGAPWGVAIHRDGSPGPPVQVACAPTG